MEVPVKRAKCKICQKTKPLQHVSYWGWICTECKNATEGKK